MKKGKLLSSSILVIVILMSMQAFAQDKTFDNTAAYTWLASNPADDASSAAWAALAFNRGNRFDDADKSLQSVLAKKDPQSCFPLQACRTKDTSLALVAMNKLEQPETQPYVDWLKGSLLSSTSQGNWLVEVTTESSGQCKFSYEAANGQVQEVNVQVDKGKFPSCGNSNFYDLNTCMPNNILRNNPTLELTADCSGVQGSSVISLIYKVSNTYYIISSTIANSALLKVSNGCFGRARTDACDKISTLYANWALKTLKSDVDTTLYLKSTYDKLSAEDNALLYLSSKDPALAQQLKTLQSPDGSWDRSVLKTALVLAVLNDDPVAYDSEIKKAVSWLATKQRQDGSLNANAMDTAITLYALGEPGAAVMPGTCSDAIKNQDERGVDCGGACETQDNCCSNGQIDDQELGTDCGGLCAKECTQEELACNNDGSCDRFAGESETNCPSDCKAASTECVVNGNCENTYGETAVNCPDDCRCGDGICDDSESETSCSDDCATGTTPEVEVTPPAPKPAAKSGGNLGTIIIIVLIIGVLAAGGYFAFKRGLIKLPSGKTQQQGGARPEYRPFTARAQQPVQRQQSVEAAPLRPQRNRAEDELEKSLAEAKKLLKK